MKTKLTTIAVGTDVRKRLEEMKTRPKESCDQILRKLLNMEPRT